MYDIDKVFEILRAILGERCSRGESVRDLHSRDLAYATPRMPDMVVFPQSEEEVCQIVRTCNEHFCPVVPFGVGSSLEGQVVPVNGGVSIDFSQMNKIISVENEDLIATVEPGVTRVQLNEYLRDQGLMFTVDPGADASIGGMCATRASGTNSVRYGTMRENVLALRVALPDGDLSQLGRARQSLRLAMI
jgi:D-lactate dehydrogenase (cytochrome)